MDHVRSHRARYQVMGFGSEGLVLDTEGVPEKAIQFTGTYAQAERLANAMNEPTPTRAMTQVRVLNFERAYQNIVTREKP